jgi:hypothetical protein
MKIQKYSHYLKILAGIISPTLLLTLILPPPLFAQSAPIKVSVNFPSGDPKGTPSRSAGGGRRGITSCITLDNDKPTITAIMPTRENKSITLAKNPELLVYIPKTTANTGEFLIRTGEDDIYQTTFKLPQNPGIVRLQLPSTVALKTGTEYKWYFTIVCNEDDRSADEYTQGIIKRTAISPSLNKALQQSTPLKQAEIYAQYDIWTETLTNVAKLREEKPQAWQELLKSVGLEIIADQPIHTLTELSSNP